MNFHTRTRYLLQTEAVGVSKHEIKALDFQQIHTLPNHKNGFGLWGGTGTGKTWALVQIAAAIVERMVRNSPDPDNALLPPGEMGAWMAWANWPEKANICKRKALMIDDWIRRVKNVKYLFLDDIGGELIKNAEDFSLGILSEIIDYRYRFNLSTWWSSNQSPDEIIVTYGSRLSSRLLSTWKPYKVKGQDYRLKTEFLPPPVPEKMVDFKILAAGG